MGKFLRVLTIFFLLFAIGALTLGTMLFSKRELLKGRAQKLENAWISIGTFVEGDVAEAQPNTFPARDTSDVTAEILDNPERSEFWKTYRFELENPDHQTLDLNKRKTELMSYYLLDEMGKPAKDPVQGFKIIEGKGTMQALLDETIKKAEEQLTRLNETRKQLTTTREELVKTIEELNGRKGNLREKMKEIVGLNEKIAQLEADKARLEGQIKDLQDAKKSLEDQVAEKDGVIAQRDEKIKEDTQEIARLNKKVKDLTELIQINAPDERTTSTGGDPDAQWRGIINPGEKGKVLSVNRVWNFAVVEFTDEFLQELLGPDLSKAYKGGLDLLIRRADAKGDLVTKVRLLRVSVADKVGVVDNLIKWQQQPIQEGDVVFH